MDIIMSDKLNKELFDVKINFFFKDEDSVVPYLCIKEDYILLMFIKNGVIYFLSNEIGHTAYKNRMIVINECLTYTWQLSKREFICVKRLIMEMIVNCSDEYKKMCLDVIDNLDYENGNENAHFQIIVDDESEEIERYRFNYRNLFYDLMLDDNSVFRGNVDDPWAHLTKKKIDGLEKRLVLSIMKKSKTLNSKIREINNR